MSQEQQNFKNNDVPSSEDILQLIGDVFVNDLEQASSGGSGDGPPKQVVGTSSLQIEDADSGILLANNIPNQYHALTNNKRTSKTIDRDSSVASMVPKSSKKIRVEFDSKLDGDLLLRHGTRVGERDDDETMSIKPAATKPKRKPKRNQRKKGSKHREDETMETSAQGLTKKPSEEKNQSKIGMKYKCLVCGGPKCSHVCQPTMAKAVEFVKSVSAGNNNLHDILSFIGYSIKLDLGTGKVVNSLDIDTLIRNKIVCYQESFGTQLHFKGKSQTNFCLFA